MESNAEMEKQAMIQKYGSLGKMMLIIYGINFISLIATTLTTMYSLMNPWLFDPFDKIQGLLKVCTVLSILCSIAGCVILFLIRNYNKAFRTAAILMVVSIILDVVEEFLENPWAIILMAAVLVISIFQMKFLIDGLKAELKDVNEGLSKEWGILWKLYWIIVVAILVNGVLTFADSQPEQATELTRFIGSIGNRGMFIWMMTQQFLGIWMLMLLRKSSKAFKGFANGLERGETAGQPETSKDAKALADWKYLKDKLYISAWMLFIMILISWYTLISNQGDKGLERFYFITTIATVLPAASIMILMALATLKRLHPFFLAAGIFCVIGNGLEFMRMLYLSDLTNMFRSPVWLEIYLILMAVVFESLQIIFLAIAISSCIKKSHKIFAVIWVGFSAVYGIVLTCVAIIPQFLYVSSLREKNEFFLKWCMLGAKYGRLYNYMAFSSRAANRVTIPLQIILLALIVVTMVVPKKIEK